MPTSPPTLPANAVHEDPDARKVSDTSSQPRAAYVHVPFCRHRCGYCNFTVIAGRDDLADAYLAALATELAALATPRPVQTLFIGGGTPTHLAQPQLARLLDLAQHWFPLATGGEFSVEANPRDLQPSVIAQLASAGVNRVSIGGQSFSADKLRLLERDHDGQELTHAIGRTRDRIGNVSLDLIFGLPGETLDVWQADLHAALALGVPHVSTYGLTFERGTRFWSRRLAGQLMPLEEQHEADLYHTAIDSLSAAGLEHYEVSNFARPGYRCRHNEVYWQADEYYAAGPGASRYVAGVRETNHRSTTTYLRRIQTGQSPVAEREQLAPEDRARETLVLALRTRAGVESAAFHRRFGWFPQQLEPAAWQRFVSAGYLQQQGGRWQLTRTGLLVSDSLWPSFLRV